MTNNPFSNRVLHRTTLIILFFQFWGQGQNVKAPEGSFGVDDSNSVIVWHESAIDSVSRANDKIAGFTFGERFMLVDTIATLSYNKKYEVFREGRRYTLYISKLPLIQVKVDTILNSNTKELGSYTYYNNKIGVKSSVGIEFRGNLSLTYPKKTYDLEFWKDSIPQESEDVQFGDLRSDDDWVLDGLYNEPLRLRSYVGSNLWKALYSPDYMELEIEAKNGADLVWVEVFVNRRYQGIYTLSESVDRKLLALKKHEGKKIKGALFKASAYEGGPSFREAPEFNNLFPHWAGFEMEYPLIDFRSYWDDLAELVDLVVTGTQSDFTSNIERHIDLKNAMDYFLFVNLLRATDNLGKNYYLARYDRDHPFFFVPWDLDGVMGIIQDGKRIPTTDDILSNGLFDRLLEANPKGYRKKLKDRWFELRQDVFSTGHLLSEITKVYSQFTEEGIYEREYAIWKADRIRIEEDYEYLQNWLQKRIAYLDTYFTEL